MYETLTKQGFSVTHVKSNTCLNVYIKHTNPHQITKLTNDEFTPKKITLLCILQKVFSSEQINHIIKVDEKGIEVYISGVHSLRNDHRLTLKWGVVEVAISNEDEKHYFRGAKHVLQREIEHTFATEHLENMYCAGCAEIQGSFEKKSSYFPK